MGTNCPTIIFETAKRLYTQARFFYEIAPWRWLADDQIVAIPAQTSGEVHYFSVMGALGTCYGLVAYRGVNGLRILSGLLTQKLQAGDSELLYEQDCLLLTFEQKKYHNKNDLKILAEMGFNLKGKKGSLFPLFRSHLPGFYPWFLTDSEAAFLADALPVVIDFAGNVKKDPALFDQDKCDPFHFRAFSPVKKGPSLIWESKEVELIQEVPEVENIFFWETDRLDPLKVLPQKNQTWQIDHFFFPGPVREKERPYYPRCVMVVDADSGFILNSHLYQPDKKLPESVADCLLGGMQKYGFRPAGVEFRDQNLFPALQKFFSELNISVAVSDEMPMLEEAIDDFLERFNR